MSGQEIAAPKLGRWPGGVNNVEPLTDLQRLGNNGDQASVRSAKNVDFANSGKPSRRRGYTLKAAGNSHSVWSAKDVSFGLLVQDGVFKRLDVVNDVEQLTPLATVSPDRRMGYAVMNGEVYVSNGLQKAKVTAAGLLAAWGVPNPGGQPILGPTAAGGLTAGRYQVAITFVNSAGEESGAEQAVTVDVVEGGGISLSNVPVTAEPDIAVRVYVSPVNGDVLYYAKTLPVGATSGSIQRQDVAEQGRALETQFHDRTLPADHLASYKGRIYMAAGKVLTYTAALRYGLVKRHENYFGFPHEITGLAPTLDGLYVGTEKATYFLGGADPKDMKQVVVDPHGIVRHSVSMTEGAAHEERAPAVPLPVWWSTNGELLRGDPNGVLAHLTRDRLALPSYAAGATMHREVNGMSQVVSVLRGPGASSGFAIRDTAVAEVIRNGVKI